MSALLPMVTVHLLLGFLGVGKTTAIRHLLSHKPADERWAVLVNEFGDIGVDGVVVGDTGIVVKQVAGGCMCCASGPITRVALNQLIRQERPDRLLIEPSGLGHPKTIVALLRDDSYRTVLRVQQPLSLIDARQAVQSRYQQHALYREQIMLGGVLVLNKSDLVDAVTQKAAEAWLNELRPDATLYKAEQGRIELDWFLPENELNNVATAQTSATSEIPVLDWRSIPTAPTSTQWVKAEHSADGYFSVGWRIPAQTCWRTHELLSWVQALNAVRLKAVLHMDDGWRLINVVDGALSVVASPAQQEAVLELILDHVLDSRAAEEALRRCTSGN